MALPRFVAAAKRLLERREIAAPFNNYHFEAYESNIDYEIRYMVDSDIVGCNWIELPAGKWRLRPHSSDGTPVTRCQIEVDIAWSDVISQIANMVTLYGKTEPFVRNVMTLDTCASIVGNEVICNSKEEDLLDVSLNFKVLNFSLK